MGAFAKVGSFLVALALLTIVLFTTVDPWVPTDRESPAVASRSEPNTPQIADPPSEIGTPGNSREEVTSTPLGNEALPQAAEHGEDVSAGLVVSAVYEPELAPASGVAIEVMGSSGFEPHRRAHKAVTDSNGQARFDGLTPGLKFLVSDRGGFHEAIIERGVVTAKKFHIPPGALVSGRVVDGASHPVSGASIFLTREASPDGTIVAFTGVDGRFSLRNVSSTRYVGARKEGFAPSTLKMVPGEAGSEHEFEFTLDAVGGALQGIVVGLDDSPLLDARVVFDPQNVAAGMARNGNFDLSALPQSATPDDAGRFRFETLPIGSFSVAANAPGHSVASAYVEIVPGGTTSTMLRLARSGRLTGSVKDESGRPIARARILGPSFGALGSVWTSSGDDGEFALPDVSAGDHEWTFEAEGFFPLKRSIQVASEQETRIEAIMIRGATIRGVVVDAAGKGLSTVSVSCSAEDNSVPIITVRTDAVGGFEIAGASSGRSTLRLRVPPMHQFTAHTEHGVMPNGAPLRITLSDATFPSVRVLGRVLGLKRQGLSGIRVSIVKTDPISRAEVTTDIEGRFECGPVPPGRYSVHVEVDGFPSIRRGPFTLARNAIHDFGDFELEVGRDLVVRVRRSPVLDGVEIDSFVRCANGSRASTVAEPAGLRAKHLAPGRHELSISGEGVASLMIPFSIEPGTDTTLDVTLTEGLAQSISYLAPWDHEAAWIRCRIATRDGATVSKTNLLRKAAGEPHRTRVWLGTGDYVIELLHDDAPPRRVEFTVGSGGSDELVIEPR